MRCIWKRETSAYISLIWGAAPLSQPISIIFGTPRIKCAELDIDQSTCFCFGRGVVAKNSMFLESEVVHNNVLSAAALTRDRVRGCSRCSKISHYVVT
jgi:hypothetical protein